jgi:hypothetical protein
MYRALARVCVIIPAPPAGHRTQKRPGWPERRALQIPLYGAPTEAHLLRDGVQRPPLLMIPPDLVIVGPPLGPPLAGQSCRRGGRLWRGERHRGWLRGCCRTGRIVHRCGRDVWGIDPRQLRSVGGEHLGQYVRKIVQQMEPIRHLAGRGRPEACRFRVRLRPIPYVHLAPGMRLQPLGHGRGLPVGE